MTDAQTARERYAIALQRLASQCEVNAAAVRRGAYPQYPQRQIDELHEALTGVLLARALAEREVQSS